MHCCQFVHGVAHHCICLIRGVHLQRRRGLYENHTHTHTHTHLVRALVAREVLAPRASVQEPLSLIPIILVAST